uniref:Secreted protein n=1 Tax=Trichogramma kaykai TaxID=54128 RepID=A0ABD2X823_9HYME
MLALHSFLDSHFALFVSNAISNYFRRVSFSISKLSEKLQRQTCAAAAVTATRQLRFLIRNDFARNRLLSNVSSSPA